MPTYDEIKHLIDPDTITDSRPSRQHRAPRTATPENRQKHLARTLGAFGYSASYYGTLLDRQQGVCAICEQPPAGGRNLHIDHCHRHGPIRGLLCGPCNRAIGELGDDADRLDRAAAYVRRHCAQHNR